MRLSLAFRLSFDSSWFGELRCIGGLMNVFSVRFDFTRSCFYLMFGSPRTLVSVSSVQRSEVLEYAAALSGRVDPSAFDSLQVHATARALSLLLSYSNRSFHFRVL